jgi:positive regulator of sigma E activity
MSLPGKVIEVQNNCLIVEVSPKPECNGCHACTGLLGGEKKSASKKIEVLKGDFNPKVGDQVILDLQPGEGSIAAILVFGVPLFAFFIGLLFTPWFAGIFGFAVTEASRFLTALVCLAIGFIILAIVARSKTVKKISLRVVEIQ